MSGLIADYFALSVALRSTRVVADQPVMHVFDPYLEQMERDRGTDHCDEQRREEHRGELRLGAQPGQRPGDSEYQEETNGEH